LEREQKEGLKQLNIQKKDKKKQLRREATQPKVEPQPTDTTPPDDDEEQLLKEVTQ